MDLESDKSWDAIVEAHDAQNRCKHIMHSLIWRKLRQCTYYTQVDLISLVLF